MSAEPIKRPTLADLQAMDHASLLEHQERLEAIHKIRSLESLVGYDEFGGSDAIYGRLMRDRYGERGEWGPPNTPSDRKGGKNWPIVLNETQINFEVQKSRVLLATNGYAQGMHEGRINYIVGKGFTYKAKARDSVGPDGLPKQVGERTKQRIEQVQKWSEGWMARNNWSASVRDPRTMQSISSPREREMVSRTYRDGKAIVRVHLLEDGDSAARFVETVYVTNPPGALEADGWSYGRRHRVKPFVDVETIEAYWVRYWAADGTEEGEEVPADEIVEVKMPREDAAVKCGLPDYSFGTYRALERAYKLQETASKTSEFRAGTAEMWAHELGTGPGIAAFGKPVGGGIGGGHVEERMAPPPRIRRMGPGQTPVNPTSADMGTVGPMVQADLRQAGAPSATPEFMISGDASNNNYASIQEAGTPFVLGTSVNQEHFVGASLAVLYCAMRHAIASGKLPEDTLDLVELHAETVKDDARQPLERAQEDQILVTVGVKSVQMCQRERGIDPEQVATERQEYQQQFGNQEQPLRADDDPNGPGGPGPQQQPQTMPGMESVEALLEGYNPKANLDPSEITTEEPDQIHTETKVGPHTYAAHAFKDDLSNHWDIGFDRKSDKHTGGYTTDIQNDTGGGAARVFAHVGKLVSHVVAKHDPDVVSFMGYGGKRAALYDKFAEKIANAHGRVLEKKYTTETHNGQPETLGRFKIIKEPEVPPGPWKQQPKEFASSIRGKFGEGAQERLREAASDLRARFRIERDPGARDKIKRKFQYLDAARWHLKYADQAAGKKASPALAESVLDIIENLGDLPAYRDASTRPEVEDLPPLPKHLADLSEKLPAAVRVPFHYAHVGLMAGHKAAQFAAKKVAQERGFSPEQTEALAHRLGHADMILSGAAKLAALGGAHAVMPLAGVPMASLGYLTYSTARDPMATVRAASKAIDAVRNRAKTPATNPG